MLTVPCNPKLTYYDMQVALDGTTYTLTFRWNTRELAWYMDIGDETGEAILLGTKVVVNFPMTIRCNDARIPPGFFVAADTTGTGTAPGIADLGDRVVLLYFETGVDAAPR